MGRWKYPLGENPMPKYVIERQYLLPIYQRLIIDAPDITTACQEAVEDDDWESAEEDGDGSGATTINAAREIPEGLLEQIERGDIHSGSFLWEDQPEYGRRDAPPPTCDAAPAPFPCDRVTAAQAPRQLLHPWSGDRADSLPRTRRRSRPDCRMSLRRSP